MMDDCVHRGLVDCKDAVAGLATVFRGFEGLDPGKIVGEEVTPEVIPSPFRELLVHQGHMTGVLQARYGAPVDLRVLRHHQDGDVYRRMILLTVAGSSDAVEFGIVRIELLSTSEEIRGEIVQRRAPLGDILIRHRVLTRVHPRWYLRFPLGCGVTVPWGISQDQDIYGRLATIECNGEPAVELLEVVTGCRVR